MQIVKLGVFYRDSDLVDEHSLLEVIGDCLPRSARPAITAVPVPTLAYDGLALQVRAMILQRHEAWIPTICWKGEPEDPPFRDFLASLAGFAGVCFPPFRPFLDTLRTQRQQPE